MGPERMRPRAATAMRCTRTCSTIDSIGTPRISGSENGSSSLEKTADENRR
jgi:hypothetical protein